MADYCAEISLYFQKCKSPTVKGLVQFKEIFNDRNIKTHFPSLILDYLSSVTFPSVTEYCFVNEACKASKMKYVSWRCLSKFQFNEQTDGRTTLCRRVG